MKVTNFRLSGYNSKLYFDTIKPNGGFYTNFISLWNFEGGVCLGVEVSVNDYNKSLSALNKIIDTLKACKAYKNNLNNLEYGNNIKLSKYDKLLTKLRYKRHNEGLQYFVDCLNEVINSDSFGKGI